MKKIISLIMSLVILLSIPATEVFAEGKFFTIDKETAEIEASGGSVTFTLTSKDISEENVGLDVYVDNTRVNVDFSVSIIGARTNVTVTFPENTTQTDKSYTLSFNPDKNDESSETQKATVKVKGKEAPAEVKVNSFTAKDSNVPAEGKTTSVSIKGDNLDLGKYTLKTYRKKGDSLEEFKLTRSSFDGTDNTKSATLTIPVANEETIYVVKLLNMGVEIDSLEILQSAQVEDLKYTPFISQYTYLSGNQIILQYARPNTEVIAGTLKDNILIDFDGSAKYESLGVDDTAEIYGNKIIVTLNSKLPTWEGAQVPKINIKRGAIKNDNGETNNGTQNNLISKSGTAIVNDAKFNKGYVQESQGGEVVVQIFGDNLDPNKTKAKVLKNGPIELDENQKDKRELNNDDIRLKIIGEGQSQTISFNLPANTKDTTETYIVMVAVDGVKYSTDIASTVSERKKKLVAAVLPAGLDTNAQTLSYMTIQSYGTQGGGTDVPDNTFTIPPEGQGSKKTLVHAYGTNLVSSQTRIRFKDENGVYWYPSHDAVHDSSDRFIMIMLDNHTGITGGGNNLLLEVIMPKDYDQDMTYTYEIAIDGENYNEVTTVSAKMPTTASNKASKLPTINELQKEVLVKHVDVEGNSIGEGFDKSYKIMKNLTLDLTQIGMEEPQEIPGYEYLYIKDFKGSHEKDKNEYQTLIEKSKTEELTDSELNSLIKLKLILQGAQNEEFKATLGDRNELVFVYQKKDTDSLKHKLEAKVTPDPTFAAVNFENKDGKSIATAKSGEEVTINILPISGKVVKKLKLNDGTVKDLEINNNQATFTMSDSDVFITVSIEDKTYKPVIGDRNILPGSEFKTNPNEEKFVKVTPFALLENLEGEKFYWVEKGHILTADDLKATKITANSENLKDKVIIGWTNDPVGEAKDKNVLPIEVTENLSLYPVWGEEKKPVDDDSNKKDPKTEDPKESDSTDKDPTDKTPEETNTEKLGNNDGNTDDNKSKANKDTDTKVELDSNYKETLIIHLSDLNYLTKAEKEAYTVKINQALTNEKAYEVYKEAVDLNNSRIREESRKQVAPTIPDYVIPYPYLPSHRVEIPEIKITDDYIYVPKGYKYVNEGKYKKADLVKLRNEVREARDKNKSMVDAANFLLEHTPKTIKNVKGKLLQMLDNADKLQKEANKMLAEYDQILD